MSLKYEDKIKNRILNKGNSYGEDIEIFDDKKTHKTILYRGCTSRFREKELIESVSSCLNKKNIEFDILSDETCCGVMLFLLGDEEAGQKIVKNNIQKFKKHGVERLITICPGCYESFHDYYPKYADFDIEIIFAMDLFEDETINGEGYIIHDPCHALERKDQIRNIVNNVPEKRANSCCGFSIGIKKGNDLKKSFAQKTLSKEKVITYCPSCYHTLNKVNSDKTVDFFTLMDEQL